MAYQTEEQIRLAKRTAMGNDLGELHFQLWHQVVWLHVKWNEYRALFGTGPEEIALLNAAAPVFFYHVERTFWQDILLHLCRLTDPPRRGKHERLSLTQLPSLIANESLRSEVQSLLDAARAKVNIFARERRDREYAHTDLPPLDGTQPEPLRPGSRKHVEDALAAIRDVMNCIEVAYENHAPVPYAHVVEPLGGAASLIFYLKRGLERQNREDEKWRK